MLFFMAYFPSQDINASDARSSLKIRSNFETLRFVLQALKQARSPMLCRI